MPRSFLDVFGRAEALRIMSKAVAQAAEENQAAGLTTASFIEGQLVVVSGHGQSGEGRQGAWSDATAGSCSLNYVNEPNSVLPECGLDR